MSIKLVLNIDEVGGIKGQNNDTVTCERDESNMPSANNATSNTYTQQLMSYVKLYSPLKTNLSYAYASDYMPFQANGEVITGLFEYNETPNAHTSNDSYNNLDPIYIYNIAKATVGAVQHFAIASSSILETSKINNQLLDFTIYPNPAKNYLQIELPMSVKNFNFKISTIDGKIINSTENIKKINLINIPAGVYLGSITTDNQTITKKIIIE